VGNEQMQAAVKELQDSMVILAHLKKNLAEITEKLNRLIGPQ
jgi:hypothetical protein